MLSNDCTFWEGKIVMEEENMYLKFYILKNRRNLSQISLIEFPNKLWLFSSYQ